MASIQVRAVAAATLLCVAAACAAAPRSHAAKAEFQREHPCPSTGQARGACPGFVIDHRVALCVGGRDEPQNMQWMTVADAKAKDRWECKPGWEKRLGSTLNGTAK